MTTTIEPSAEPVDAAAWDRMGRGEVTTWGATAELGAAGAGRPKGWARDIAPVNDARQVVQKNALQSIYWLGSG